MTYMVRLWKFKHFQCWQCRTFYRCPIFHKLYCCSICQSISLFMRTSCADGRS